MRSSVHLIPRAFSGREIYSEIRLSNRPMTLQQEDQIIEGK